MNKRPWYQRVSAFVFQYKQIMVIDHRGHEATRNRRFYPVIFWSLMLLLMTMLAATMFLAGNYYKPFWQQQDLRPQYLQLQRLYQELRNTLNETSTQMGVRDEQINMLKSELETQQQAFAQLQERIHLYDSLLAARKDKGLQMLQFSVHTLDEKRYDVNITLVRGQGSSRYVNGWIKLFAKDEKGKKQGLLLSNSQYKLKYHIESHAFLHETARWLHKQAPGQQFFAHVYDSKGKLLLHQELSLEGNTQSHVKKKQ